MGVTVYLRKVVCWALDVGCRILDTAHYGCGYGAGDCDRRGPPDVADLSLFDNAGKFSEYVHEETIKSVCEAFPRNGWSEAFACAVEKEMAYVPSLFPLHLFCPRT
jgi:hypothetical protein